MKPNEFVETLSLKNQEIYRGDCPACGNKNTFSVKNMGDAILYNCFHADCEVKGKVKSEISKSSFSNDKKVWNTNSSFAILWAIGTEVLICPRITVRIEPQ